MHFQERIEHLIESGFQAMYIPTAERSRCEDELSVVAKKLDMKFVTWDAVSGFSTDESVKDPLEALLSLDEENDPKWKNQDILFILRNMHVFLEDPAIRQAFQNLYFGRKLSNEQHKRPIFVVSSLLQIHPEISDCLTVVEFSLPDEGQLKTIFEEVVSNLEVDESRGGAVVDCLDEMKERCIQAMRGLTTLEAENNLAYSLRVNRGFGSQLVSTIEDQKASTLEKSEVLSYVPKDKIASMDEIGGYECLKEFINIRKLAYTKEARELGIDSPKGIILIGQAGTGKSVIAKMIARELDLPLIMFNLSAVYGSLVGESERRMRTALATVDAIDSAVLLIDEMDKSLAGSSDQTSGDSGVARRVFGTLLTWLADKSNGVFCIFTMNRLRGVPAEFTRKGRIDDVFWVDLPDNIDRDQILRIHCKKRGIDTKVLDGTGWTRLIEATNSFCGAELEATVVESRFMAFASRRSNQPTIEEMLDAASKIVPLAISEKEQVDEIRKLCEGRIRSVSKPKAKTTKKRNVNIG